MFKRRATAQSYICAHCRSRQVQRRTFASDVVQNPNSRPGLPSAPPPSGAAKLTSRRLIFLHGVDSAKFLQGLITNDVLKNSRDGYFAGFLDAKGKILNDAFVYPIHGSRWQGLPDSVRGDEADPGFLIEVDSTSLSKLLALLKRHKLRSKLTFRALEENELNVWSIWKEGDRWTAHGQQPEEFSDQDTISLTDSRAPGMGHRLLLPDRRTGRLLEQFEEAPLSAYTIRRYVRGVPEGESEMRRGETLPMNYNFDLMGGIDFKKGCYSGQELTIRTHHTGVVRRRILPVALYNKEEQGQPDRLGYDPTTTVPGAELAGCDIGRDDQNKRSTGNLVAAIGNIGLGMCRLEQMTDLVVSGEGSSYSADDRFVIKGPAGAEALQYGVKAFVPDWLRGQIRAPKLQKRVE